MDPEDLSLPGDADSENSDTIKNASDEAGDVAQLVEQEMEDHPTPVEMGNGGVSNRYRQIMQEQHLDGSDVSSLGGSSVLGLPRRAGSPINSMMSEPDDTPSVQVRTTIEWLCSLLTRSRALSSPLLGAVFSPLWPHAPA